MSTEVVKLLADAVLSHSFVDLLVHRLVWVVRVEAAKTIKPCVGFLLTQEAAERSVSTAVIRSSLAFEPAAVLFQLVRVVVFSCLILILVSIINFLSIDVELTELVHIVDHLVAHLDTLSCLVQGILVAMDLRQDSTVLKFELGNYKDLSHAVRDALFF